MSQRHKAEAEEYCDPATVKDRPWAARVARWLECHTAQAVWINTYLLVYLLVRSVLG